MCGVKRRFLQFGLVILGLIVVLLVGGYGRAILPTTTEILWDTYGVPHVIGKDARGAFQVFGWAQMQSHGDLLLRLYGQGELSKFRSLGVDDGCA